MPTVAKPARVDSAFAPSRIETEVSEATRRRINMSRSARNTATASGSKTAQCRPSPPGRVTRPTPTKATVTADQRRQPIRSPSNLGANRMTKIGLT